jgi:hypothetical protein
MAAKRAVFGGFFGVPEVLGRVFGDMTGGGKMKYRGKVSYRPTDTRDSAENQTERQKDMTAASSEDHDEASALARSRGKRRTAIFSLILGKYPDLLTISIRFKVEMRQQGDYTAAWQSMLHSHSGKGLR